MHAQAYDGFARMLTQTGLDPLAVWRILDVGGADVNGSVRGQLPNSAWVGVDIAAAPGVDIVADAATWTPPFKEYDLVVATELFEHAQRWPEIIMQMAAGLCEWGPEVLIATCASTGRPGHGARGEAGVPVGEYYGNVDPELLKTELGKWFKEVHVEYNPDPGDAYMWARGVLV